jgi:surfeit locus 1 family protein
MLLSASCDRVRTERFTANRYAQSSLALIPIISFGLGAWQIQRLDWKTKLIAKFEDRLVRPPLPLPPRIDPDAISEFDYRRVYATGHLNHEKEMLVGPRMHDGEDGFVVVTPLEREGQSTVLVNRGWISRKLQNQKDRPEGLPQGEVKVEGLLREPWKKNMFTPDNKPEDGKFYFPDINQMAELSGSQPVWIEQTMGKMNN